ncbi:MAG: NUDIX domain-containing protein [Pseudomonadales bacterium]|nr:NUDIX domain-containing protein [Pseudomonadales bacterium]
MEIVDIVNAKDEVTGNCPKVECHEKGILHRVIISELIDSHGNWILVKQANDRQDAGQYVSPVGGHIRSGETEEEALRRETEEELGITEFDFKFVGKKIYNREVIGRKENHYFIVYEIYSDEEPVLNHESDSYERFSRDQLLKELKENPKKFGDAFHFVMNEIYNIE